MLNPINPSKKFKPTMPKGIHKSDLPVKICPVCGRPFTWRKKWEKNWDEVIYCSKACKMSKNRIKNKHHDQ